MTRQLATRRHAIVVCIAAAATVVVCAGLLSAAVLMAAPAAVLPFVIAICVGCPMLAACELPAAVAVLSHRRAAFSAVEEMRRQLERIPETRHPLGL